MKKTIIFLSTLFIAVTICAQSPQKISYQAIIRDSTNKLVTNTVVGMQISILQGNPEGEEVYVETHKPNANSNGLISINIGEGVLEYGNLAGVNWSNNKYFVKTEIDPNGGEDYTVIGSVQLLSVPYALYSNATGNLQGEAKKYVEELKAHINLLDKAMVEAGIHPNKLKDKRDNNIYNIVRIGDQTWMAENLKYLPNVVGSDKNSKTIPYCYVYGYDSTDVTRAKAEVNYKVYGVLYNWVAAMNSENLTGSNLNPSGVQGICPDGWHLPSDAEWTELIDEIGGSTQGGKLKETGTTHWLETNTDITNETGFTAIPAGQLAYGNKFLYIKKYAYWWSTTVDSVNPDEVYYRCLMKDFNDVKRMADIKSRGLSVRCVKNK